MRSVVPLLVVAAGCAPAHRVVTIERDVWQAAVVPPASGPVATGPLADFGVASIELELSGSVPVEATESRKDDGVSGHIVPLVAGEARISGRLADVMEGALAFEVVPGSWVLPAATDLSDSDASVGFLVRGGPQFRIAAPISKTVSMDFQGDLRLAKVMVERFIQVTETTSIDTGTEWHTSETYEIDDETWTPLQVLLRGGVGLGVRASDSVHIDGGLMAQTTTYVPGHKYDEWTCYYYSDRPSGCSAPAMPPISARVWVGTVWAGLGLRMGHAWLLPQVWWHAFDDKSGAGALSPMGGAVALRIPLGQPKDQFGAEQPAAPSSTGQVPQTQWDWEQTQPAETHAPPPDDDGDDDGDGGG